MDRFVKNFIWLSIFYLAAASVLGVMMMASTRFMALRFVHSHLMLLGWVSMMIYGVGYHILPKFAGRFIRHRRMAEIQFWSANIGLVGMLLSYGMLQYAETDSLRTATVAFGIVEAFSIFLFFYNMTVTVFGREPAA